MSPANPIPVTMLSGFLGAGKTTLLRELLTQTKMKIGCIVNDVAAINIDAKLVRNQQNQQKQPAGTRSTADLAPTIELQNGCACCTIQDELFLSFEQVLAVADKNGVRYDRIVLENSGVAEPQNIRETFAEAIENGHPVMQRIYLSSLITVVDAHTFIQEFACRNALATRPDLGGDGSSLRPVVDLLVEQCECADYVVLNKVDLLGAERVPELEGIIASINPLCSVVHCSHGKADMDELFGPNAKQLLASLNTEGQHRGYVTATRNVAAAEPAAIGGAHAHGDGHSHDQGHGHGDSNGHGHGHGHSHVNGHGHGDSNGHDHGHGHGHGHDHGHGHGHGHDHAAEGHVHDESCGMDCGHDHSHDHAHKAGDSDTKRSETTAAKRFGITSFVYQRRRPFHPKRVHQTVLQWMPVSVNRATGASAAPANNESPIRSVIRSKGFMWMASGHATAFYWSHAGQHFEIRDEGDWWAVVPDDEWPENAAQRAVIMSDFAPDSQYGDRRQEIVFIGTGMDQAAIEAALDSCLLTDEEMKAYDTNWAKLPDPAH